MSRYTGERLLTVQSLGNEADFASDYTGFVAVKRGLIICLPVLDPPCNYPRQSLFSFFGSRFVVVFWEAASLST